MEHEGAEQQVGEPYVVGSELRQMLFVEREYTQAEDDFLAAVGAGGWTRAKQQVAEWKSKGGRRLRAEALGLLGELDDYVAIAQAELEAQLGAPRAAFTVAETKQEIAAVREDLTSAPDYVGLRNQAATCYLNSLLQVPPPRPPFPRFSLTNAPHRQPQRDEARRVGEMPF